MTNTEPTIDQLKAHVAATAPPRATPFKPLENQRLKRLRSSESDFGNQHAAVTRAGVPFTDTLNPEFWANHGAVLRVGDVIEVHTDDQIYFGRLLVRNVAGANKTRVSVAQLELHVFNEVERAPSDEAPTHRVEHRGPHLKWSVINIASGKNVSDGHETKEAASGVIANMMRKVA
jgi:hypothetical protein